MSHPRNATLAFALSLLAACGDPPPPRSPAPAPLETKGARTSCPLGLRNAHVRYDDTATGGALFFSAGPEGVDELRRRAKNSAAMHGPGEHRGAGHDGKHGSGGGRHGVHPAFLPPAQATFDTTEDGARLMYTPDKPEDLDRLRDALKARASHLMSRCVDDPPSPEPR